MTFSFNVLLNWVPNPIWFSKRGTRYLSNFPWEQICWCGRCIRMNQCMQQIPVWYPLIPRYLFISFNALTLGNAVSTWSGQVHPFFCGVPYIILISAEYTVPELFIPRLSPHINLITLPNRMENITDLIIIILSETWHYFQILLVVVDISWNTIRGFY